MKSLLLFLLFLSLTCSLQAQKAGYDEDGKKILLNDNGTWEYTSDDPEPVHYVYYGDQRFPASERIDMTTSISARIINRNERAMIMFIENCTETEQFFDRRWTGRVYLYLDRGERFTLLDRNITGIIEQDGKYIRYSGHYLTSSECDKLKQHNISGLQYTEDKRPDPKTIQVKISSFREGALREPVISMGF